MKKFYLEPKTNVCNKMVANIIATSGGAAGAAWGGGADGDSDSHDQPVGGETGGGLVQTAKNRFYTDGNEEW